ncbi:MAG: hypothetical protein F6K28_11210 [Microcoleus sp. SIO2G3]|nr:hypothetical protein [Microcoleus sp. SIO2G3]
MVLGEAFVAAVREALGPGASLMADANSGYTLEQADTLAELDASLGDRYYLDGGTLHLKLVAAPGREYAAVYVDAR